MPNLKVEILKELGNGRVRFATLFRRIQKKRKLQKRKAVNELDLRDAIWPLITSGDLEYTHDGHMKAAKRTT